MHPVSYLHPLSHYKKTIQSSIQTQSNLTLKEAQHTYNKYTINLPVIDEDGILLT